MSKLTFTSGNNTDTSRKTMGKSCLRTSGRRNWPVVLTVILLSLALTGSAISAEPVSLDLNAKLRGLLIKEMLEVQSAMQVTYSAIVQGDHATVAQQGQAIHDSFILEQSLTEKDQKDLVASVPGEFLQMDERFHQLAAALAEAGRQKNTQGQVEVFSHMTESCVACHSRYVPDRFDGLQNQSLPETWGQGEDQNSVGESHH